MAAVTGGGEGATRGTTGKAGEIEPQVLVCFFFVVHNFHNLFYLGYNSSIVFHSFCVLILYIQYCGGGGTRARNFTFGF